MYSAKQSNNQIRVFNALTGAPHFNIPIQSKELANFWINGNTLTINLVTGITQIWDLTKRSKIR